MAVIDLVPPALPTASPRVDPDAEPAPAALLLTGPRAFWVAIARRFVFEARVRADVDGDATDDTLAMLEAVVVDVLHQTGARSVTVSVRIEAGSVQVEVRERGSVDGFHAGGVATLDRLAERWGVSRRPASTELWFRVARWREVTEERFTA